MKNKLFKSLFVCVALLMSVFSFAGCGKDPETPETPVTPPAGEPAETQYTLIFDADNDVNTPNTQKVVAESAINDRSTWEAIPDQDGFAGEWVIAEKNETTIRLKPNYGDGSAANPYLISNITHLTKFVNEFTKQVGSTIYYDATGDVVSTKNEATTYVQTYPTYTKNYAKVVYDGTGESEWRNANTVTNKVHVRLINDIDFADATQDMSAGSVSMVFDGGKYDLLTGDLIGCYQFNDFNNDHFVSNEGLFFYEISHTTIKNLIINQTGRIATIAYIVKGEGNLLDNITANSTAEFITVDADDNNEGPFVGMLYYTDITLKNLTNNINFMSYADNFGIFCAGWGFDSTVTFENCVNNGNTVTKGCVGIFYGNNARNAESTTLINCVNNGVLTYKVASFPLCGIVSTQAKFTKRITEEIAQDFQDSLTEAQYKENGSFAAIESKYTATIVGNDIKIAPKAGESLVEGTYELILVRAFNAAGGGDGRIAFKFTVNVDEAYLASNSEVLIKGGNFTLINRGGYEELVEEGSRITYDWKDLESHGRYKYDIDETNGYVIIDTFGEFEYHPGTINYRSVVVTNTTNQIIDFVVDFS